MSFKCETLTRLKCSLFCFYGEVWGVSVSYSEYRLWWRISKSLNPNSQFKFKRLCKQVFALLKCPTAMSPCQLCGCCSVANCSLQNWVHFYIITVTAEPEEDREEMAELSAAPTAKRPCQCCCQTYSEILSFLEKRSEAEHRLREEELALRREELEIQRSKRVFFRELCSVFFKFNPRQTNKQKKKLRI